MITMVRDRKIPKVVYMETLPFDLPNGGRSNGNVNCPWHEDRHASLSVDFEKMVFYCHACCQGGRILESSVKPLSPGKPAFQLKPFHLPRWKRQTWTEVPVFGGVAPQAPAFTYRDMWLQRGRLTDKSQCGLQTRVKYGGGKSKKGFRLVCWQWACADCFNRLRDWWLQRLMSESHKAEAFVFIRDNWSLEAVLKKLSRLAKQSGNKLERALITAPSGRYLFLRGIRQVFETDLLAFEDIFPPNVEINYNPTEQQLRYAYWNALDHDGSSIDHRRKIRLSRNFLSDENDEKAEYKVKKENEKVMAELHEEIMKDASEEEKHAAAPKGGKGHWSTFFVPLEDIVEVEEKKGAIAHWISRDYVEFIWPDESIDDKKPDQSRASPVEQASFI